MERYDPERMERTTRDIMSRSSYLEMQAGRACKEGGIHIDASHLGAKFVEDNFPGMCSRCRQFKYDLAREPVPVSPSAHYIMGGAAIDKNARSSKRRLFVAGEDSGGVHGANRLGGNGICDSCVYGRQAGKAMSDFLKKHQEPAPESVPDMAAGLTNCYMRPFQRAKGANLFEMRDRLRELNWNTVGVARKEPDLSNAVKEIEEIAVQTKKIKIEGHGAYNMPWHVYIDLLNMIEVSRMVAESAKWREETRGAHFRSDYPEQDDAFGLFNIYQSLGSDGKRKLEKKPVDFKYISLEKCQRYEK